MVLLTNNWRHSYVNRWIGMENCYYSISIGVHYNWIYITIPLLQYYEWIGLREPSQENPMIFMGQSMVARVYLQAAETQTSGQDCYGSFRCTFWHMGDPVIPSSPSCSHGMPWGWYLQEGQLWQRKESVLLRENVQSESTVRIQSCPKDIVSTKGTCYCRLVKSCLLQSACKMM